MKTLLWVSICICLITSCRYAYVKDYTGEYNFELYYLEYDSLGVAYATDTLLCTGTISRYQEGDEANATTPIESYEIAADEKAWLTISYNNWTVICHVDESGAIEPYSYGSSYTHSGEFTDDTHILLNTFWGGLGLYENIEVHGEKMLND